MRRNLLFTVFLLFLVVCLGCAPQGLPVLPATSLPVTSAPVLLDTPALQSSVTPRAVKATVAPSATPLVVATPTLAPYVVQTCPYDQTGCILDGHFLMQRPISAVYNNLVDATYRYGSTQGGMREPHHGVEFPNEQGTPVLAVADGTVVFAGSDKLVALAWVPAFYGNVIVIEHHFPGFPQPVFSLYGHLSAFKVTVGQQVHLSDQIGQVGSTGKAIGSHLHFEVRYGTNTYLSNRNPELWLAPLPGTGVLAGRIQSLTGELVPGTINVQRINNGVLNPLSVTALESYVTRELQPVNGDDAWQESFAAGELPAGDYRLSIIFNGRIREQTIKIEPGKLTFVRFIF